MHTFALTAMNRLPFNPKAISLLISLACAPSLYAQNTQNSTDKVDTLPTVEVNIDSRSSQGSMRPGALRDDIIKTESISARTIERSGASNLNEAIDKNPGIAVQVECSICNVRNVLLNNLPGRYTTLLIDGIPIYSSVSSAYGLDSVSVHGVERIDIARGTGASLIAPEALAGTVNIISKRPTEAETHLRSQIGNMGSRQADAYLARPLQGGALTATLNYNRHDAWDGNGDGISEYTGYDRRMAGLGFFADDAGGFKLRGRLDIVDEERGGGALETYRKPGSVKADDSGNPFDFSAGAGGSPVAGGWINPEDGSIIDYDLGKLGYSEYIHTKREQFVLSGTRRAGAGALRLALGTARHRQESFYEFSDYNARQSQHYAEASYQVPIHNWLLTAGANYRYENLRSNGVTEAGEAVYGVDNYTYKVPALFLQAYSTFLNDRLEVNGSVRYDDHNVYGGIVSPRLNALYQHSAEVSSRFSVGKGFRAPTSFYEQDHGILDTLRIDRQINKPEVSHNLSYALNYANERLAVTGSYNYNRIKNFALLDAGHEDAAGNPVTLFTSTSEKVVVQGVDVNLSYLLTPALTVSAAAEAFHYRFPPGTLAFARPKARAFFTLDYERGPWEAMARLNITGPMDLNKFHDDGSGHQNRYNFDGTPKRSKSPTFATFDTRVQYAFSKNVALFIGADNLFDYYQSKKESPLWIDPEGGYDVTHLWGPSRGRYIYAGAKISF